MSRPLPSALVLALVVVGGCGDAGRLEETCSSNSECAESELCATNFCTGIGFCEARPESCDETSGSPVCGCDGITYPNSDCAAFAGVRLQAITPCVCANNSECFGGQYCARDDSCELAGECFDRPETCEPVTEPVCGCDFETYANECEAASAGARVSAQGECECQSDADCESNEFCDGDVCDGPGVCALRDDPACEPAGQVTGCDGVQYEDRCAAAEEGVRVRPD
jgi:hypothetical protein